MNISVFGLGYVGCISLGCFAEMGHNMIGVDINKIKVDLINSGRPTIIEKGIDKLIKNGVYNKKIKATDDYYKAVMNTSLTIICVGTPTSEYGHLNLKFIENSILQIAKVLKRKIKFHTIVIRSTVLPGTINKINKLISKVSGKKQNIDFAVVANPEFLREGSAVHDFYNPSVTVVASDSKMGINIVKKLYKNLKAPLEVTDIGTAEIIKFVNNSYHALKVTFANEIGNICKKLEIDSNKVMDLFCKDNKLNISEKYFKPGFAYGGSCLPKDLKAINTIAYDNYIKTPVLNNIDKSNNTHKKNVIDFIINSGIKNIGILGISFKKGTDDLRQSPIIDIIETLIGKGYQIKAFDELVNLSNLIGANKEYIYNKLPHISGLLCDDFKTVLNFAELLIVNADYINSLKKIKTKKNLIILDLINTKLLMDLPLYNGICW